MPFNIIKSAIIIQYIIKNKLKKFNLTLEHGALGWCTSNAKMWEIKMLCVRCDYTGPHI